MKKLIYILAILFLVACKDIKPEENKQVITKLAPLDVSKNDYDSFNLNGKVYKLPTSYEEFSENGIVVDQNKYFHQTIGKNQQLMATLKGEEFDLGVTFKNPTDSPITTTDGTIIELYVNSAKGANQDFSINGLSFGADFDKALLSLRDLSVDEAADENKKTINYYTDKNYVTLYFTEEKLTGAAIFSKAFMRDQNYVAGEFIIFGQTLKFPFALKDLEELMMTSFDLGKDYDIIKPGDQLEVRIYSPVYESLEQDKKRGGLVFTIKNTQSYAVPTKEADIVKIKAVNSPDLSVGNIYVGASIDELKKVDKKNQIPRRLDILGKNEDDEVIFNFAAENNTSYVFTSDVNAITEIEVINKEIR